MEVRLINPPKKKGKKRGTKKAASSWSARKHPRYRSGPKKGKFKPRAAARKKPVKRRRVHHRRAKRTARKTYRKPRKVTIRRSVRTGKYIKKRRGYSNPLAVVNPGGNVMNKFFDAIIAGIGCFGGGVVGRNLSGYVAPSAQLQALVEILIGAGLGMFAPRGGMVGKLMTGAAGGAVGFGLSKLAASYMPGSFIDVEGIPAYGGDTTVERMGRLGVYAPQQIAGNSGLGVYAADSIGASAFPPSFN